jgi:hypothetical protein
VFDSPFKGVETPLAGKPAGLYQWRVHLGSGNPQARWSRLEKWIALGDAHRWAPAPRGERTTAAFKPVKRFAVLRYACFGY